MNSLYIDEYIQHFERVLSISIAIKRYSKALEKTIAKSNYFRKIEMDNKRSAPIILDDELYKEIFPEIKTIPIDTPIFVQCLWAAEAYLRIQGATGLSFECIFLYIPIDKMYDYFPLYHEMDFEHIIKEFERLFEKKSAFSMVLKQSGTQIKDLSRKIGISSATLYSLKQRKRDIKKYPVEQVIKLADYFNINIRTICEIDNNIVYS